MFVDQYFRKQRLKILKTISSLQIMQTFAPFVFATGSDVCTFSQPAISAADRRIRSRVLTFEDMEQIASTGRLTPIAPPPRHSAHPRHCAMESGAALDGPTTAPEVRGVCSCSWWDGYRHVAILRAERSSQRHASSRVCVYRRSPDGPVFAVPFCWKA